MLCRLLSSQHIASCIVVILLDLFTGPAIALNFDEYLTETSKGTACAAENKLLGPFYIPNNQCSGVIYDIPQHCELLQLVKVMVTDYAHVKISIDNALQSASINRAPNLLGECPGRAIVRAALACGPSVPSHGPSDDRKYTLPPV
ncbi:unnamed protein product [Parnassius apollo]|uniref:(apollo) hypothetical protein n=1 Tax=Parnassius apollo TaxID=110799 RepID=A0A8S3XMH7_PARAO|nr:unnamed protein product [Parnassius apollo]